MSAFHFMQYLHWHWIQGFCKYGIMILSQHCIFQGERGEPGLIGKPGVAGDAVRCCFCFISSSSFLKLSL